MSIDLADLVDNLKREVNPPGQTIFTDATDSDYEGYLEDSFWELSLRGYITGFDAVETVVSPEDGSTDADDQLSRGYQQLVIINAAMAIVRVQMINIDTTFRAHAGPVEFETGKSASALRAALDAFQNRFDEILEYLPSENESSPTFYNDVLTLRNAHYFNGNDYSIWTG